MSEVVAETEVAEVDRPRNSNQTFVNVVNTSSTIDEAAERLGLKVASVRSRITALKKQAKDQGIKLNLKKLPSANRKTRSKSVVDMAELAKLAESLLKPEVEEAAS
jgi:DNA-binding Lrp family transcriptional regulator